MVTGGKKDLLSVEKSSFQHIVLSGSENIRSGPVFTQLKSCEKTEKEYNIDIT